VSVHVVVPLKARRGKTRLMGVLAEDTRSRLIGAMLAQVCAALGAAGVRAVSILTSDADWVPSGCEHIADAGLDLNAALDVAARQLTATGSSRMLILAADLPFVTPADIEALIEAGEAHPVVIAPDLARSGTNALLLAPPLLLEPHFGTGSFAAHTRAARAAGLEPRIVQRDGLARDIDTPQDLQRLMCAEAAAYDFLRSAQRA
jgi:2-phospho-L-lactate guanylyltransferase